MRVLLLLAVLWGLSRIWIPLGGFGRHLVESRLCADDGPKIEVGRVSVRLPAQVRIRSLSLRSDLGLSIRDAELELSLLALAEGRIEPASVRVDSAQVHLPDDWRAVRGEIAGWSRIPILASSDPLPRLRRLVASHARLALETGATLAEAEDFDLSRRDAGWTLRIDEGRLPGRIRVDDFRLASLNGATDSFRLEGALLEGSFEGRVFGIRSEPRASVALKDLDLSRLPLLGMGFPRETRLAGTASGNMDLRILPESGALGFRGGLKCDSVRATGFPFQKSFLLKSYFPELRSYCATGFPVVEGRLDARGLEISKLEVRGNPVCVFARGRIRPGGGHRFDLDCEMDPDFMRSRARLVQTAMERTSDGRYRLGAVLEGTPEKQSVEVSGAALSHALSSPLTVLGALLE